MTLTRRGFLQLGAMGVSALAVGAVLPACDDDPDESADSAPSDVASAWFEQFYDIVKTERTSPPVASRVYGIAAIALYESIVSGTKRNSSLVGQLNGLQSLPRPEGGEHHWPTVASAAVAAAIRALDPAASAASLAAIGALEQRFAEQSGQAADDAVRERSARHGEAVAAAVLQWASTDGSAANSTAPYTPSVAPGAWKPTPPQFAAAPLLPGWGRLRPMVMTASTEFPPPGSPPFSTSNGSAFHAAAVEVHRAGRTLTDEQKAIADYWSDGAGETGTPPGHWIAIVSQMSRNDRLSLAASAEAYARVGIAVHDAFICCWNTKYTYDLQRPVTYIVDNIDPTWLPYLATPAFPSYTSGHSTQSGAAASVLSDMFGQRRFTDTTHVDHALPRQPGSRTFDSFEAGAAEAAVSRLYGGIHYVFDNDDGLVAGQSIGRAIVERIRFHA